MFAFFCKFMKKILTNRFLKFLNNCDMTKNVTFVCGIKKIIIVILNRHFKTLN